MLYIELMDRDALAAGTMSERNSRQYLAWVNALRLCLREIGVDEAKPDKPVSLDQLQTAPAKPRPRRPRASPTCQRAIGALITRQICGVVGETHER
jgi:hypothetical protein